jgi:glycosyltransferase involved in cell wall biosynthesis
MRRKLEAQIQNLGLQDYIKLLGYVPNDKVTYWLNAADLFVLPSLSESFGVVQIEAMACGKPVVATKNGGSEEVIVSEEYGLLCESANSKDLAEKILIALDKDWDREKLLEYAQQFTWDKIAKETMKIYEGLL